MRKIVLLIALFMGQFSFAQDFYLGVKTGLNLSSFSGEGTNAFKQRAGLHGGITAELNFSDFFSLQTEVLYSKQGVTHEDNTVYPADYIGIPLVAKLYPIQPLSIDLGGQFSYLLNDEYTKGGNSQSLGLAETDYLFVVGATYKTEFDLFFQVRYLMGISEIDQEGDWKNQVFQVSIGYNFL